MNLLKQFSRKFSPVAAVVAEPDLVAVPIVLEVQKFEAGFSEEYVRVAQKVGVRIRSVITEPEELARVLLEEGIPVYPLAKVEAYMDSKGYWGWFPAKPWREVQDIREWPAWVTRETPKNHEILYGSGKSTPYSEPIPLPVLLTMEKIQDRLGERAIFWVAALDEHPDPFLGVMLKDDPQHRMYVVERWDEPGFRG